jgi:diguanylate cyclase (GGDEF)-like protein
MKKFGRLETLAAGGACCVLGLLILLAVIAPGLRVFWLVASVVGLAVIVGVLFRQLIELSKALLLASTTLDEQSDEIQRLTVDLTELSLIDPLTGSRNRRGFMDLVEHQMKVAQREWKKLHFVFVDLDGMKAINEHYGNGGGDAALIEVVQLIWASSRTVDVVGRMGGDEFAIALIHADDPSVVAARIEAGVLSRTRDSDHPYELRVSVGVATFDPAEPITLDEMLSSAEQAMNERKQAAAEERAKRFAAPSLR